MTKELENRAKQIFEEKYSNKFGADGLSIMSSNFKEVYDHAIIPSIVQALNEGEYKKHLEQSKKDFDSAMEELSEDRERRRLDSETTPVSAENARVQIAEDYIPAPNIQHGNLNTPVSAEIAHTGSKVIDGKNGWTEFNEHSAKNEVLTESKIKPGQTLKAGDYVVNLSYEECFELFSFDLFSQEGMTTRDEARKCYRFFDGIFYDIKLNRLMYLELDSPHQQKITKYHFTDFLQLCKNTFQ